MAIKAADLVGKFGQALNEGWGYIINTAGGVWTLEKQKAATDEQAKLYGTKWIGKKTADCSGLFYWAFKELGGSMYHGSNTMWLQCTTAKGELAGGKRTDGQKLKPGTAVFKVRDGSDYYHVGLYIGGTTVIEAKGTRWGVTTSSLSAWHAWAELKGVKYQEEAIPVQQEHEYSGVCMVYAENGKPVNVRSAPNGAKVSALSVGSEVEVLEDRNGWCRVSYAAEGWILKKYLSEGRG